MLGAWRRFDRSEDEGKARVVAAMVEGRRKWLERRRAEGKKFPAGRKRGERWVTEPMRERARAEAHRLKGGRFALDRSLTLALLRSVDGCLESTARAKLMLDAQELAAMERDRQAALARIAVALLAIRRRFGWPFPRSLRRIRCYPP